jgi:hypothetical protein
MKKLKALHLAEKGLQYVIDEQEWREVENEELGSNRHTWF